LLVAPARPAVRGLVAGAVVLVVLAVSVGSGSPMVRALAGGGCASADSGHVGLVIDFGNVTGHGTPPAPQVQTACLALSSGETGDRVLAAAGLSLRWGSSGLLCAINGYPASGCGQTTSSGTDYWSYWHGGSVWTYATTGPASSRPAAGGVEGWRFVHVTSRGGAASAPVPSPEYAASGPCPAVVPPTTAAPTTTRAPTAPTSPGVGPASSPTTSAGARSSSTTSASGGGSPASSPSTVAGGPSGTGADDVTTAPSGRSGHDQQALPAHGEIVAQAHHGSPLAPVLVLAVIVALGVSTVVIRRRRSSP
jgi:hypothetical protein